MLLIVKSQAPHYGYPPPHARTRARARVATHLVLERLFIGDHVVGGALQVVVVLLETAHAPLQLLLAGQLRLELGDARLQLAVLLAHLQQPLPELLLCKHTQAARGVGRKSNENCDKQR